MKKICIFIYNLYEVKLYEKFYKKYCYLTIPFGTCIIICIIHITKLIKLSEVFVDEASNIIQISGTLIGFLLTAITIFLSLPKDTKIMQRIKRYNHHKIFSRCVSMGLIILTIDICLWLVKVPNIYIVFGFLLGLEETLMAAYYIYKLCIYNFE